MSAPELTPRQRVARDWLEDIEDRAAQLGAAMADAANTIGRAAAQARFVPALNALQAQREQFRRVLPFLALADAFEHAGKSQHLSAWVMLREER